MVSIERAGTYIKEHCDPLYSAYFSACFTGGATSRVFSALKEYQRSDGGFGGGLEPDFLLPDSSPMAVTKAFQIFERLSSFPEALVGAAVSYLEDAFIPGRQGWKCCSAKVNEYPHAPWWEYKEEYDGTVIDLSWGNPTCEIIGILNRERELVRKLDIDGLVQEAIGRLQEMEEFTSEHEIYCYLSLFDQVNETQQDQMILSLRSAINSLLNLDSAQWNTYVPRPFDFITDPNHRLYSLIQAGADMHLKFIEEGADEHGLWEPNWRWGQYEDSWRHAKENWKALIAIRNYTILERF